MKKEIRYCSDRRCDGSMPELYDPKTPLCFNEGCCGTTYCQTQLDIGCPRGFITSRGRAGGDGDGAY